MPNTRQRTLIQVAVYMKVGHIYRIPDFVVALDKLWQALIEQALNQLDIVAHFWKSAFQTKLSLQMKLDHCMCVVW